MTLNDPERGTHVSEEIQYTAIDTVEANRNSDAIYRMMSFPMTLRYPNLEIPLSPKSKLHYENKKIRSVDRRYLSHCRNSIKINASPRKNFTEIGQSAAELWPKTTFDIADDCQHEFNKLKINMHHLRGAGNISEVPGFHSRTDLNARECNSRNRELYETTHKMILV